MWSVLEKSVIIEPTYLLLSLFVYIKLLRISLVAFALIFEGTLLYQIKLSSLTLNRIELSFLTEDIEMQGLPPISFLRFEALGDIDSLVGSFESRRTPPCDPPSPRQCRNIHF